MINLKTEMTKFFEKEENFWAAVAVFVVILLWLFNLFFLIGMKSTDRGTIGDMFGVVNSLFSGLAFAGVIFAILLQKKDLSLQRLELELTREELKRSAKAQEESEKALKVQAEAFSRTTDINTIHALILVYDKEIPELEKQRRRLTTRTVAEEKQKENINNKIREITYKKKALERIIKNYHEELTKRYQ